VTAPSTAPQWVKCARDTGPALNPGIYVQTMDLNELEIDMPTKALASDVFQTVIGSRTFPFMEDEGDDQLYYGYGHQDRTTFAAALDDFYRCGNRQ